MSNQTLVDTLMGLQNAPLEEVISTETGLSAQVVRLGLETSLHRIDEELAALAALEGSRASSGFISLAGNVFSACLRPFVSAAVFGVSLKARVSSREGAFATALAEALQPFCNIELLHFPSTDYDSFRAVMEAADFCEAYGSDDTVDALQALTSSSIIRRGHGLGVALLGAPVHGPASITAADYDALAEDIAAYDQRGCLSPRVVFAEGDLKTHAAKLDAALTRVEKRLPRGQVPAAVQAASSQWRASAAALLPTIEGASHTLVLDGGSSPRFPLGPTHRHILLRPVSNAEDTLRSLGPHTKVIGHAGLAKAPVATCRVCPLGEMQRPRLSASADGYPAGAGFIQR